MIKHFSIWKFEIPIGDHIKIEMPECAKILSFQKQYEKFFIWAIVDIDAKMETRTFRIYGTGHDIFSDSLEYLGEYIGTVQQNEGQFVWHLFEVQP